MGEATPRPPETDRVRVTRDEFGKLHFYQGDEHHEGVRPLRAFPLTAPERHISFVDFDGKEVGNIPDLREVDAGSRQVVEAELEMAYFTPHVTAIREVRSRFGVTTWTLVTDRGPRVVYVRDRSDIRPMTDGRIIITDVHGIKFEIGDPAGLDEKSRMYLDSET